MRVCAYTTDQRPEEEQWSSEAVGISCGFRAEVIRKLFVRVRQGHPSATSHPDLIVPWRTTRVKLSRLVLLCVQEHCLLFLGYWKRSF